MNLQDAPHTRDRATCRRGVSRPLTSTSVAYIVLVLAIGLMVTGRPAAAQSYILQPITTSSTDNSIATGLNNSNQVVGKSEANAYSWDLTTGFHTLFTGGASAINDEGEICGNHDGSGVLYANNVMAPVSDGTYSATCINATGAVGGESLSVYNSVNSGLVYVRDAYTWFPYAPNGSNGSLTDLGLGYSDSFQNETYYGEAITYGINDVGNAVGVWDQHSAENVSPFTSSSKDISFLKTPANRLSYTLPVLPGDNSSFAYGINNTGSVVGSSVIYTPSPITHSSYINEYHAYLWTPDTPNGVTGSIESLGDLGTPGSADVTTAYAINDASVIVGTSNSAAFVWDRANGMRDLNSLIAAGSGWTLSQANAVNEVGCIVGTGMFNGMSQGFLLVPSDPLTALSLSPTAVYGGAPCYGKVTLTRKAPMGGESVYLKSSSATVSVPLTVYVPAGSNTATFTFTTSTVAADTLATVTARLGYSSATSTVNVLAKYVVAGTVATTTVPLPGARLTLTGYGSFELNDEDTLADDIPAPSSTGITHTINVTESGTITGLQLGLNITHPHIGNLIVTLVSPDGTSVVVHNKTGGSAKNIVTDLPGLTTPDSSLSVFNGKSVEGTWTLTVRDTSSTASGTLNSWDLTINYSGSVSSTTTSASNGTYSFGSLRHATYTITPTMSGRTFSPTSKSVTVGPSSTSVNFTSSSLPVITSFTPTAGAIGTVIVIKGTAFTGATSVTLHAHALTFAINSDAQITATVPSSATTGTIAVTTAAGTATSSKSFTVTPPPVLTSLSPTYAYAVGGTVSLTVAGTGFVSGSVVKFGSTSLATTYVSTTQLTATITAALRGTVGTFAVTVVNPGGVTTHSITFTVKPRLTSLAINPSSVMGGQSTTGTVTLNQVALPDGATISLSSSNTSVATVPSSVTVPAGALSVTFSIATSPVSVFQSSTITATGYGATKTAVVSVQGQGSGP